MAMKLNLIQVPKLEEEQFTVPPYQGQRQPMRQPIQQPMPEQPMPEQPQGLLGRIGAGIKRSVKDPNFMDRLTIGLGGMTMNPNEAFMDLAQNRINQRQKLGLINEQKNRTIEALKRLNTPQAMRALQFLDSGGDIGNAVKMAFASQGKVMTSAEINAKYPDAQVQEGGLYNVKADGTITKVGGNGVNINLGDSGAGDLQNERIRSTVKRYTSMQEQAQSARFTSSQVSLLGDLLSETDTGLATGIKQKLYEGLGLDLRSDTQVAAQAMLSKLVPAQREKGSGPMSDLDLDEFKNSLPSLKTTPEGNALIVETLQAIAAYQIKMGDIVDDVYADPQFINDPNKLMSEIAKRQREMVDPLLAFKRSRLANSNASGAKVISIRKVD
jgi:hypothetical protein